MAAPVKLLVDIPSDKGIHTKSAGEKGEKYVYKYIKYYRNDDGNPRNKAKLIGKVDVESGRMIPNANYYEMFKISPEIPDLSVWLYGYTYIVQKSCKDMGLFDCLQDSFDEQTNEIVAVATYIISKGNAMDGIDDFQELNLLSGLGKHLTSQSCSRLFESIDSKKMFSFFKRWVTKGLKGDTVCYDVTSVSSYSKTMTDIEYGYNRDKEDLPQFNLGMFCCETSKLPLYYNRYNGSLTDKTNLSYVLANAESVGLKKINLILDGGFISEECFISLNKSCNAFTIGIPAHLDIAKEMIKANINGITNYHNKLPKQEIFCIQQMTSIHSVSGKLLLYFDPQSHANLCSELSNRIEELSDELSNLKRCPVSKLKRYSKYFIVTKGPLQNKLYVFGCKV
jgi:hypothetical protein